MSDLTTLSKAKEFLRISGPGDDLLIERLVSSASQLIETYLNRIILSKSYVEKFDGKNTDFHLMSNYPISSIEEIKIDGSIYTGEYIDDKEQLVLKNSYFTRGKLNCIITYTAGFTTVPFDIEQACLELVAIKYKQLEHIDLSSKVISGETTSFIVSDIPAFIKITLNNYRKVGPY